MKIKEIKIINRDESTEIADIGADAINVDYNDTTVKAELDELNTSNSSLINTQISQRAQLVNLQSQVNELASGSPLAASSIAEMTDTSHVYVNTTDGHWYYYSNNQWNDGGVYLAIGDLTKIKVATVVDNSYIDSNGQQATNSGYVCTENISVDDYDKISIKCTLYQNASIAFLDSDNMLVKSINGYNAGDYGYESKTEPQQIDLDIPSRTAFIRATYRKAYYSNPLDFNITLFHSEDIETRVNKLNKENKKIIYVGQNEEYTSILKALKETDDSVKLYIKAGTYDIAQEYKDFYGQQYWANYETYVNNPDYFSRGLWINNGREIEFDSKAILTFNENTVSQAIRSYFSIIALGFNATIKGATFKHTNNIRYAIHDDAFWQAGKNTIEKCVFDGTSAYGFEIGGGLGSDSVIEIKDCVFLNNNGTRDISYHNNGGSTAENRIFIKNCYGSKKCVFLYYGTSTKKTYCFVSNSCFESIEKQANTESSTVDNMEIIEWNNNVDEH